MALDARSVVEINASATANNVNAGGFNPANANMLTDLTTHTNTGNTDSPVVSSASYAFVAGDTTKKLFVQGGTNWYANRWFDIASLSGGKATLSAAIGAGVYSDATQGWPTPSYKATTVAGVASVGTPTGGVFTLDCSQHTAACIHSGDGVSTASTNFTSVTGGFSKALIGNFLHLISATGADEVVGWYEIVNVTDANTLVLDRVSGTYTLADFYIGGAMSLNSALDDDLFEIAVATAAVGGMRFFVKKQSGDNILLGEAVTTATNGLNTTPIIIEGYNARRGDAPAIADCPTINSGTATWSLGQYWEIYFCNHVCATSTTGLSVNTGGKYIGSKAVNSTTTSTGEELTVTSGAEVSQAEVICYRGDGIQVNGSDVIFTDNYIHDSNIGVRQNSNNRVDLVKQCIIADNVTAAWYGSGAAGSTGNQVFESDTFYGAENKLGVGIDLFAGSFRYKLNNNIICGFVTGAVHDDTLPNVQCDYNNWLNNTTDVTKIIKGSHDLAVDPQFTNVTQITGTGATSSTNVLTAGSGTPFTNVVDGVDVLTVISGSGTGFTTGKYFITSHTDTTLTCGPGNFTSSGSGSAIVWQITQGHDFSIGTNLKAQGFPGVFPGGLTTGYTDIGAVQRQEANPMCGGLAIW